MKSKLLKTKRMNVIFDRGRYWANKKLPLVLTFLLACIITIGNAQSPVPFTCSQTGYIVGNNSLYAINTKTGASQLIAALPSSPAGAAKTSYNAMGYNNGDNYLWATTGYGYLAKIGQNGYVQFFNVPGLPNTPNAGTSGHETSDYGAFICGSFDMNGNIYLYNGNARYCYIVNVSSGTPVYIGKRQLGDGNGYLIADWVYDNNTNTLAAVDLGSPSKKYVFNAATEALAFAPITINQGTSGLNAENNSGSIFTDVSGTTYVYGNYTGSLYRINNSAPYTATKMTKLSVFQNNDGANCACVSFGNLGFANSVKDITLCSGAPIAIDMFVFGTGARDFLRIFKDGSLYRDSVIGTVDTTIIRGLSEPGVYTAAIWSGGCDTWVPINDTLTIRPKDCTIPVKSCTAVKSVSDASGDGKAQAGEDLTYTINVKNTGTVQLNTIAVSDIVPAHTSYVSGGTYNSATNTVSFTGTNLAVGETASYSFVVQVANDLTGISRVSNQAAVVADTIPSMPTKPADPNDPNNPDPSCTDASGCTTDIPVQGVESFVTWKSVSDASGDGKAQAGEVLTYTIKVRNTGNVSLTPINVTDTVPVNTSYISGGSYNASNNIVQFSDNMPLAVDSMRSYSFQVQVTNNLTGISKISNQAAVVADTIPSTPTKPADPNDPNNPDTLCTNPSGCTTDIPVQGVESFVTWKSVSDASGDGKAQAGEVLTYTIKVRNTGNVSLTPINVTDTVPVNTSYISGGSYNASNNIVQFSDNMPLAVDSMRSYSFQVQVTNNLTGISKISNQATVVVDTIPSTPTKPADPSDPNNPDPSCTDAAGCTTDIPVQGVESFVTWKSVSDASGDGKAQAGEVLTYTIKVRNTGNVSLTPINVTDTVPVNTSYISGGSYNASNNIVQFSDNMPLAVDSMRSYSFQVQVTNNLTGISKVSNQAAVVADTIPSTPTKPADPNDPNNPDTLCTSPAGCTTDMPVQGAESFITWKSVIDASGDGKAQAGEVLTYTIKVRNTGNVSLTPINVTDTVPVNTSYISGGSYNASNNIVQFSDNMPLAVDSMRSYSFQVQVTNNLTGISKVSNQAAVVADTIPSTPTKPADPNDPNKPDTLCTSPAGCTTDMPVQRTESFITWKSVSDASKDGKAQAGENLTYTINVKNTGTVQLNQITVSDVVPANTIYVSGGTYNSSTNTVSFNGANLAIGATASYSFVVRVTSDLIGISKISNQAAVVADTIPSTPTKPADPNDPNNPDTLCTSPAGCTTDMPVQVAESFITWKSVSDASKDGKAQAGENLTYTINVKNTGTIQLNQITVSDVVPANTIYVSGGTYNSSTNTVSFNGANLAIGATASYSFVVRVTSDLTGISKVSNQATVVVDNIPSTPTKPADPANPNNPDPSCTNAAGCTTDIPVQGNFHIPNVITPNGDGYNDRFVIQGTDYDQVQVTIFNRWNNVVYQNQMYQNNWDGNGLNVGTYFYVVKAFNKISQQWEVYKGWVMIMR